MAGVREESGRLQAWSDFAASAELSFQLSALSFQPSWRLRRLGRLNYASNLEDLTQMAKLQGRTALGWTA
jgi:hypothetical protein